MSILSRLLALMYKLPPVKTRDLAVEKKLDIPMRDGAVLRADRYYPRRQTRLPAILIRTPYGRAGYGIMGELLAPYGFQVLIQSCRGTDDSDGEFSPFRGEREDGLDTLEWLNTQEWFDGRLGMTGPSYLGFTQWAVAAEAGPMLKAISTQVTSSEFRSPTYPGESFAAELWLQWLQIVHSFKKSTWSGFQDMLASERRLKAAALHLPLSEADVIAVGKPTQFWHDLLTHTEPGDPWWTTEDFSSKVADITAPNHLVSGWYDIFLPQLLRDYTALHQAGRRPYLTIGPWSHSSNGLSECSLRESIQWLCAYVRGDSEEILRRAPVRIYVMGVNEWRDLPEWPPHDKQKERWYLQPEAALSTKLPAASAPSRYPYDPTDPTPNLAGAINTPLGRGSGARDNRSLEARSDVLTFTSAPLKHDFEIIGPVTAELYVSSSLEHTDFFVRLCDVHPTEESMNLCDGLIRLSPGHPQPEKDGVIKLEISLWPTAHCFRQGHRIRVQVSSGAFPRFARNLGTGEPPATGTAMRIAEQKIYHDPQHPSAIILPYSPTQQFMVF